MVKPCIESHIERREDNKVPYKEEKTDNGSPSLVYPCRGLRVMGPRVGPKWEGSWFGFIDRDRT